nr:hypothetical protein [uncultured bacterium]
MKLVVLIFILFGSIEQSAALESECTRWFEQRKIKRDKDCLLNCSSAKVDMGTFTCHEACPDLCRVNVASETLFSLASMYGLTPKERALVAKNPAKCLAAYQLSWDAEKLCKQIYIASQTNDASDACRHFVWASLLTRELGLEFTNQILNAHESNLNEPEVERSMDLANNRQGQLAFQSLKNKSDEQILENFRKNLKSGNLVIIKNLPENIVIEGPK